MLEDLILSAPARNWTTSEEADICCHPQAYELNKDEGWCYMEDNCVCTYVGDKLEPISDNLYRITWMPDLHSEYGEFTVFNYLRQALDLFFNHR